MYYYMGVYGFLCALCIEPNDPFMYCVMGGLMYKGEMEECGNGNYEQM